MNRSHHWKWLFGVVFAACPATLFLGEALATGQFAAEYAGFAIFGVVAGFLLGSVIDIFLNNRDLNNVKRIKKLIATKYPDAEPGDIVMIEGREYRVKGKPPSADDPVDVPPPI